MVIRRNAENRAQNRVKRQLEALEGQVSEMHGISEELEKAREEKVKAEKALGRV